MRRLLVGQEVWQRIRELNDGRRGGKHAAVAATAYFGRTGARLLPLVLGDTLYVAATEENVASGLVCPEALLDYPEGVRILRVDHLHGKLYCFGSTAIVGSANVSESSVHRLREIAVEIEVSTLELERLSHELRGKVLTSEDLQSLRAIYRRPRGVAALLVGEKEEQTKPTREASLEVGSRIWYHGTFDLHWAGQAQVTVDLPSLFRLREGDWYVLVYWKEGQRIAQAPRSVVSVTRTGRDVTLQLGLGPPDLLDVPASAVEALTGAPANHRWRRWLLLSRRVEPREIVAVFSAERESLAVSRGEAEGD